MIKPTLRKSFFFSFRDAFALATPPIKKPQPPKLTQDQLREKVAQLIDVDCVASWNPREVVIDFSKSFTIKKEFDWALLHNSSSRRFLSSKHLAHASTL